MKRAAGLAVSLLVALMASSTAAAHAVEPGADRAKAYTLAGNTVSLVYTVDGTRVIASVAEAGANNGYITVVDADTGRIISNRKTGVHGTLVMSPRGDRLFLLGTSTALLLDPQSGEVLASAPANFTDVAFNSDGSRFYATRWWEGDLTAYDSATLATIATTQIGRGRAPVAVSPSGDRVVTIVNGRMTSFDPVTLMAAQQGTAPVVSCALFSPSGDRVYTMTSGEFGQAAFAALDPVTLEVIAEDVIAARTQCPVLSPDGSRAFINITAGSLEEYGPIAVVDTASMTTIGSIATSRPSDVLRLSADGQALWIDRGNRTKAVPLSAATAVPPRMPWLGSDATWAAMPGVASMDARLAARLSGPFIARESYYPYEGDGWEPSRVIVHTPTATREQTDRRVTYWSATEVCSRRIGASSPGTIAEDRRARFGCRARATELDPQQELLALLPARYLAFGGDSSRVVSSGAGAADPLATSLDGAVYQIRYLGMRAERGASYSSSAREARISWWSSAGDYVEDNRVDIAARGVPRLPAVSSLRR